jgi:hypothetical protein
VARAWVPWGLRSSLVHPVVEKSMFVNKGGGLDFGTIARRGMRWFSCCIHGSIFHSFMIGVCVRASVRVTLWGGGVGGSHPRRLCVFLLRHPIDDPRHPSSPVCVHDAFWGPLSPSTSIHNPQASLPRLQDEERRLRAAIAASIAAAGSDPAGPAPLQDSSNRPGTSGGGSRPGTAGTLARPGTAASTACGTTARRSEWRMRMCLSSPTWRRVMCSHVAVISLD